MLAAVLKGKQRFEIEEFDIPQPGPDEVLLRVLACGVCRSELNFWKKGLVRASKGYGFPGHEIYGQIESTGENVKNLKKGDHAGVIMFPGRGYAQHMIASQLQTLKIPEAQQSHVTLGEPLACIINAFRRFSVKPSDVIVLIGVGFMGSMMLNLLRSYYSSTIIAIDTRNSARKYAQAHKADYVFAPDEPSLGSTIKKITNGRGADIVIEVTGTQDALNQATDYIGVNGQLVIVGYHDDGLRTIDLKTWNYKGINVINAHERSLERYLDGMSRGLTMLQNDRISLDMVSHSFSLEEINDAFKLMEETPEGYLKAIVEPWK